MPDNPVPGVDVQQLHTRLARALRHEIGDFLQKVYATLGVLQSRLPLSAGLERELLNRLLGRAAACRQLIDAVQDFLCPMTLTLEAVDLRDAMAEAAASVEGATSVVTWRDGPAKAGPVRGDRARLVQVARVIVSNSLEAGANRVAVETRPACGGDEIEWSFQDDGPGLADVAPAPLFTPFAMARPGHLGLGLAIADKIVKLHNGQIDAGNAEAGGFVVRIRLPRWSESKDHANGRASD